MGSVVDDLQLFAKLYGSRAKCKESSDLIGESFTWWMMLVVADELHSFVDEGFFCLINLMVIRMSSRRSCG